MKGAGSTAAAKIADYVADFSAARSRSSPSALPLPQFWWWFIRADAVNDRNFLLIKSESK